MWKTSRVDILENGKPISSNTDLSCRQTDKVYLTAASYKDKYDRGGSSQKTEYKFTDKTSSPCL